VNQNRHTKDIVRKRNFLHKVAYSFHPIQFSSAFKNRIYKTINLPVVLYGCETWSVTLRVEHGLRVSEERRRRDQRGME
jgi:hypothetical protein